jgi:hypothetical protein
MNANQYYQGMNPLGEAATNGINYPQCPGFIDQAFFPSQVFTLTAGQSLFNQLVPIDTDADFIWRGLVLTTVLDLQFSDSENYAFSNDFIPAQVFSSSFALPFPIFPETLLPAGGKASFNIRNSTVGTVTTTIFLIGCKRYRRVG